MTQYGMRLVLWGAFILFADGVSTARAQVGGMPLADMHFHALQNVSPLDALKEMDRDVLAQLPPEAAKRIGYENAQRLFRLSP